MQLTVTLGATAAATWNTTDLLSTDIYLRLRDINFEAKTTLEEAELAGPMTIQPSGSFTADGEIILEKKDGTAFGTIEFEEGAVLYTPKMDGADPVSVMHKEVISALETSKQPFGLKADPSIENKSHSLPPAFPTYDPGASNRPYIIGLYDGGATYNHLAYRPAGECRMRHNVGSEIKVLETDPYLGITYEKRKLSFQPFCYVCKYALVNRVHPVKLGKDHLDKEYLD